MGMTQTVKLQVIIGSTRQNRFSEKPAQWIFDEARRREGVEAELVDLRDYPLPFYDEPVPPARLKGQYSNEVAGRWVAKIAGADGYIIVSPEYNHGYPAVLKNALDYAYSEWNRKAVGFLSYGGVSGARVIEQLRQVVIELEMAPIRSAVHLPLEVFREAQSGKADAFEASKKPAEAFLDQLLWWTRALKAAREQQRP